MPRVAVPALAETFHLDEVTLPVGSRLERQRARNGAQLLVTAANTTDLMCDYLIAANMSGTIDAPACKAMDMNGYHGHYLGHWLSATAQMFNATGNATFASSSAAVVGILGDIQAKWTAAGEPGFLHSYTPLNYANLLNPPFSNCAPVCVPFYIQHKLLAGLLDQYQLAHNDRALAIAVALAGWTEGAINTTLAAYGENGWQQVLRTEWGGMNDALWRLAGIDAAPGSGLNPRWSRLAELFNHWDWTAPLAVDVDDLVNNHANTHLPEVIGDAHGYAVTGNATKRAISTNFFTLLNESHTWATGGSNDGEYWGPPMQMGDQLNADTEESCTQYNVLKLSKMLFGQAPSAAHADFQARAFANGLMGNQLTSEASEYADPNGPTGFEYMLPLGGYGLQKPWGASNYYLPCCWGTLSESMAILSEHVFYRSGAGWPQGSPPALWVAQFYPATARWTGGGLSVTLDTAAPYDAAGKLTITFGTLPGSTPAPQSTLSLRVPFWATSGKNSASINGVPVPASQIVPGEFLTITRAWAAGDVLQASFPPVLRWEALKDTRPAFASTGALLYGDLLLAGLNATATGLPVNPAAIGATVTRNPDGTLGYPLSFTASYACPMNAAASASITLVPLADVTTESYAVYWVSNTSAPSGAVVSFNSSTNGLSVLPGASGADWAVSGGASIVGNGPDLNIRSGDPGQHTSAQWTTLVQDPSHVVTAVSFRYRYVTGYGPAGSHVGANFSLVTTPAGVQVTGCNSNAPSGVIATLYSSGELTEYSFDACNTCYSPWVNVTVPGLRLPVANVTAFAIVVDDNNRNVQLDLPMALTITWGSAENEEQAAPTAVVA